MNLPDDGGRPRLRWALGMPAAWNAVAKRVIEALGARPLTGEHDDPYNQQWPALRPGGWGYVAHEVGTLPMSGDKTGVVDPDLQVEGVAPGLFVCDNSIFPTSPSANPSLTLAALALRLAAYIRGLNW